MKKIISIVLAVMLVVSVTAVSVSAYNSNGDYSVLSPGDTYAPSDSYTVDANTPYAEDAVRACGGSLENTQKIYFQAIAEWANKFNTFEGPDSDEPYMHVCAYWASGIGSKWSNGATERWVGYQAHLENKENLIYYIQMPNDGDSPMVVWNNGVNGGMDRSAEILTYARQIADMNTEGAEEGDYDTLPEGSPDPDSCDGLIAVPNLEAPAVINPLTEMPNYAFDLYVYYGEGCYGYYPTTSENYHGRLASCVNPNHDHPRPGDVNDDKVVNTEDVISIQRYLAHLDTFTDKQKEAADVDGDEYISIVDATRIQRYLAHMCNIDGSKPYDPSKE